MEQDKKQNDLIMNMVSNPTYTAQDFLSVGVNPTNTSLMDESFYSGNDIIRNMPAFKKPDGSFDDVKFHKTYQLASAQYNLMANDTALSDQSKYIKEYLPEGFEQFLSPWMQRDVEAKPEIVKVKNPNRISNNYMGIGVKTEPTQSKAEIAQTQQICDLATHTYKDSPNDSFWSDFFSTKVLAQWDFDADANGNPTSDPNKIVYHKGEDKLNENGTYYYETLNGRSPYGKQVLNKLDTLTTDGSTWNKFDFFDSDDIQSKSTAGSTMKNLVLVGSMFLPYVGPVIRGLAIAKQTAQLGAVAGKMVFGSDVPVLNNIEGFMQSISADNSTEESKSSMLTMENFLNLVGDTTAQLAEQRFLFEYAPSIFKGTKLASWKSGFDDAKTAAYEEQLLQKASAANKLKYNDVLDDLTGKGLFDKRNQMISDLNAASQVQAARQLNQYVKDYQEFGAALSKGYMTAVTVGDTYGEAKQAGASDMEATFLTLGYAWGEKKILDSEIGEWIMPELRGEKFRLKAIAKALLDPSIKEASTVTKSEAKLSLAKRLMQKGRAIADEIYTDKKGMDAIAAISARALGEGTEEVSEELLKDFSYAAFNTIKWFTGDDKSNQGFLGTVFDNQGGNGYMSTFQNMLPRYGMNFFGGVLGGGIMGAATDFKMANPKFTSQQAQQQVIQMIQENKEGDLIKAIQKSDNILGNKYQSTQYNEDGTPKMGTETDNQDLAAKQALIQQIAQVKQILEAHGAQKSADSVLDDLTLHDIRFNALANSATGFSYIQEWNKATKDIVTLTQQIKALGTPEVREAIGDDSDTKKRAEKKQEGEAQQQETDTIAKTKEAKNKELQAAIQRKNDLVSGKLSQEFIGKALYEMTALSSAYIPNFAKFAEIQHKKKFELLSDNEKEKARQAFKNWNQINKADQVSILYQIHMDATRKLPEVMKEYENALNTDRDDLIKNFEKNQASLQRGLAANLSEEDDERFKMVQNTVANRLLQTAIDMAPTEEAKQKIRDIISNDVFSDREKETKITEESINTIDELVNHYAEKKWMNPQSREAIQIQLYKYRQILQNRISSEILDSIKPFIGVSEGSNSFINSITFSNDSKTGIHPESTLGTALRALYGISDEEINDSPVVVNVNGTRQSAGLNGQPIPLSSLMDFYYQAGVEINPETEEEIGMSYQDMMDDLKISGTAASNINSFSDLIDRIDKIDNKFNSSGISDTPIIQLFDKFMTEVSGKSFTKIFKEANNILNRSTKDISQFNITEELGEDLKQVQQMIGLFKSVILGARNDNVGSSDIYGFTTTLNEIAKKTKVENWEDLVTIDEQLANLITADMETLGSKIAFIQQLDSINRASRLNGQTRVGLNKNYVFFNKMQNFVQNIPDDEFWKQKKAKLQATLGQLSNLKTNSGARNLLIGPDVQKAIEKEMLQMEDAIYDFFQDVKGDKNKLKEILPTEGMFDTSNQLMTEQLESVNDRTFWWYLASRTSIKSSDFYSEYKETIDLDGKVASIPTQEMATYLSYSFILNGNTMNTFMEAAKEKIVDDWTNAFSEEKRKSILIAIGFSDNLAKQYAKNEYSWAVTNQEFIPRYSNMALVEGVSGSGKTTAVDSSIVRMLKKYHPDLLKNAFISNNTKDNSLKLQKDLGFEENKEKALTKEELLRYTQNNYIENEYGPNGEITNLDGQYDILESGLIQGKIDSKSLNEDQKPSIIFIDEVGQWSLFELDQINAWAKANGVAIIASGDYDQSTVNGTTKVVKDGKEVMIVITGNKGNFITCPKLGVSMRPNNVQKDSNNKKILAYTQAETKPTDLSFNYYMNKEKGSKNYGLYGDLAIPGTSMVKIEPIIQLMIDSRVPDKDGKLPKIGYIYYSENSPTYKLLSQDKYKDVIDMHKGSSAQGLEAQYYIHETNPNTDKDSFMKDFYTSLSRAQQGSLIIDNGTPPMDNGKVLLFQSNEEKSTQIETYKEEQIKNYSIRRKKLLDELLDGYSASPSTLEARKTGLGETAVSTSIKGKGEEGLDEGIEDDSNNDDGDDNELGNLKDDTSPDPNGPDGSGSSGGPEGGSGPSGGQTFTPEDINDFKNDISKLTTITKLDMTSYINAINDALNNNDMLEAYTSFINALEYVRDNDPDLSDEAKETINKYQKIVDTIKQIAQKDTELIVSTRKKELLGMFNENEQDIINAITDENLRNQRQSDFDRRREAIDKVDLSDDRKYNSLKIIIQHYLEKYKPKIPTDITIITDNGIEDNGVAESKTTNSNKTDSTKKEPSFDVNWLQFLLYSFNTYSIGYPLNEDGTIDVSESGSNPSDIGKRKEYRFDGLRGIFKVLGFSDDQISKLDAATVKSYINKIGELRSALMHEPKNNDHLKDRIFYILSDLVGLEPKSVDQIEFFAKTSPVINHEGDKFALHGKSVSYAGYDFSSDEKTLYNGATDVRSNERPRTSINSLIKFKDKDGYVRLIEIPILTTTNFMTVLDKVDSEGRHLLDIMNGETQDSEDFIKAYNTYVNTNDQQIKNQSFDEMIDILETKYKGKYKGLATLISLYHITQNQIFKFGTNWTPSGSFLNTGVQLTKQAGDKYRQSGFLFNPNDFIDINKFVQNGGIKVSKIYSQVQPINGIWYADRGHAFVLVTDNLIYTNEQDLFKAYIDQQNDSSKPQTVKRFYVIPPRVSYDEYADWIHTILHSTGTKVNFAIGNNLTPLRILQALQNAPGGEQENAVAQLLELIKPKISPENQTENSINSQIDKLKTAIQVTLEKFTNLQNTYSRLELRKQEVKLMKQGLVDRNLLEGLVLGLNTANVGSITNEKFLRSALDFLTYRSNNVTDLNGQKIPPNQEAMQIINSVIGNKVIKYSNKYYKAEIAGNAVLGISVDQGSEYQYSIKGKPYLINGKIDTSEFYGSFDDDFNEKVSNFVHESRTAVNRFMNNEDTDLYNAELGMASQSQYYKEPTGILKNTSNKLTIMINSIVNNLSGDQKTQMQSIINNLQDVTDEKILRDSFIKQVRDNTKLSSIVLDSASGKLVYFDNDQLIGKSSFGSIDAAKDIYGLTIEQNGKQTKWAVTLEQDQSDPNKRWFEVGNIDEEEQAPAQQSEFSKLKIDNNEDGSKTQEQIDKLLDVMNLESKNPLRRKCSAFLNNIMRGENEQARAKFKNGVPEELFTMIEKALQVEGLELDVKNSIDVLKNDLEMLNQQEGEENKNPYCDSLKFNI